MSASSELSRSTAWRLVHVLESLASAPGGRGIREMSRRTGIDKSAVARMVAQLVELDMVRQDPATLRYTVGPRLYAFGATIVAMDDLGRAATPVLEHLSTRFNETCYLAAREAGGFLFRVRAECTRPIRYVVEAGVMGTFHAGAAGRAILAGMSPAELTATLSEAELTPLTDRTVTDRARLEAIVAQDRERGFSFSAGERVPGGTAIAAPFFDAAGVCRGSVVFTRPAERHDHDDMAQIAAATVKAARELSARLGHVATERLTGQA